MVRRTQRLHILLSVLPVGDFAVAVCARVAHMVGEMANVGTHDAENGGEEETGGQPAGTVC